MGNTTIEQYTTQYNTQPNTIHNTPYISLSFNLGIDSNSRGHPAKT